MRVLNPRGLPAGTPIIIDEDGQEFFEGDDFTPAAEDRAGLANFLDGAPPPPPPPPPPPAQNQGQGDD